jgi:hypothetical protein
MTDVITMTKQEIFDHVLTHLRKQGKPAINETDSGEDICAYRTDDGLKCAVGCLIPDDKYNEDLEGRSATVVYGVLGGEPTSGAALFLVGVQLCLHDNISGRLDFPDALEDEARRFARQNDLEYKEPTS